MKTLLSSTEEQATYEFTFGDSIRIVEYRKPHIEWETEEQPFDHEAMSEAEYQNWLTWLGEVE